MLHEQIIELELIDIPMSADTEVVMKLEGENKALCFENSRLKDEIISLRLQKAIHPQIQFRQDSGVETGANVLTLDVRWSFLRAFFVIACLNFATGQF